MSPMPMLPSPALGPQPFLDGPTGRAPPNLMENFKPPYKEPTPPLSPRNENERVSILKWDQESMEKQRHKDQLFIIKQAEERAVASESELQTAARQRRDDVLAVARQKEAAKDARAQLLIKAGSKPSTPVGSPRARQGPKDAKAPPPREVTQRYQPVANAIAAEMKSCADYEVRLRRERAALVGAMASTEAASTRDRISKQQELGQQAGNLLARRDAIDAQRAAAAAKSDAHQRTHVAKRDAARSQMEATQRKILELRAKKEVRARA